MIQNTPPVRSDLRLLFDCGRLVVRLGYHIQHAAFLFEGGHRIRSRAISRKIVRLARRLEPTAKAGEVLAGFEGRVEKLIDGYRNEWMYDAVASIVAGVNDPENWSEWEDDGEETRRFECERHLRQEVEALASIRSALLDGHDWEGRLALELGAAIEQGTRPGDAYMHFFRPDGTAKRHTLRWGPVASYRLAPVPPGGVAPQAGWLGQIRAMLRDLGRFQSPFDCIPRRLPDLHGDRHRAVVVMARAVRDRLAEPRLPVKTETMASAAPWMSGQTPDAEIATAPVPKNAEAGGAMVERPTLWKRSGYPGIEIHEEGWRLRRGGKEVRFFRQSLPWHLMIVFLAAGEDGVSREDQIKVWREHGRTDDPAPKSLDAQFSKLNGIIEPLGIRVDPGDAGRRCLGERRG